MKCINCENDIRRRNGYYCSLKCKGKHERAQKLELIKSCINIHDIVKCVSTIKRYILDLRGHQCEICKNIEWQGKKIPLILDHIDGNSGNWLMTNLRLVCGNCDMQLDTYKSKNIGNGRAYRRERYKQGKSY